MKVCVLKLGGRIAYGSSSTSGGTGEALAVIKIMTESGIEVDAWTKPLAKDGIPPNFNVINILDEYEKVNDYEYDALVVLNGSVNYFGGQDSPEGTLSYHVMNNFDGPVYYVLCDPNLLLKQIWPSVAKKDWASNYKQEDIEITREDIVYISQPRDIPALNKKIEKTKVAIKEAIHFPFEQFVYLTMKDEPPVENYEWDLLYGGTFRGGRRELDMIKFYFGYSEDIKVQMFGKIKETQFKKNKESLRHPEYGKAVPYEKFNEAMRNGLATVIIGDKLYKELDDLAQRIYESVICGNVVFIDASYDKNKIVFGENETLRKFCYVDSREDVEKRLNILKNKPDMIPMLIKLQKEVAGIDKTEYSQRLRNIIENN